MESQVWEVLGIDPGHCHIVPAFYQLSHSPSLGFCLFRGFWFYLWVLLLLLLMTF